MLKKSLSILCVLCIVFASFTFAITANAEASSVRAKKIVSVVYDDSGSMADSKWEYTSYAMQCFAAMLNKEDILDITYMSVYTSPALSVDTSDRAASVKKIREHTDSGGTPSESIDYAFQTMKSHNDSNPNTQYWLIVMTDGQMSGTDTAENLINKYADTTMPNGTKPQIIYMTLGDENETLSIPFTKSNIESVKTRNANEVVQVISDISSRISGRYAIAKEDIDFVDKRTVKVRADVPLHYIGVLTQRSSAVVDKFEGVEIGALKAECQVPVELPNLYSNEMSDEEKNALKGNVSLFCNPSQNISPDTYTITFTEDISADDLVIMFEPALTLRLIISNNGKEIADLTSLAEGQVVDIEAAIFESGTNNRILPSMLPATPVFTLTLSEDGTQVFSDSNGKIEDVKLKALETIVEAKVEIPGFITLTDTKKFTPTLVKLSDLTATVHYDGSERIKHKDGTVDGNDVVYITELENNKTGIKFTLFIDEVPLTKEESENIKQPVIDGLKTDFDNFKVEICDDGSVLVYPSETKVPALFYWFSHKGESNIELSYGEKTAIGTIRFEMGSWFDAIIEILALVLILLAIIYLLLWLFVKPHFKRGTRIEFSEARRSDMPYERSLIHSKTANFLTASGLLNFFGLTGMKKKKVGIFTIRIAKDGYVISNIKGKRVSTFSNYPGNNIGVSKERTKSFSSTIYISDGDSFYKISISNS